jgi:hypothetical protein
MLRTTTTGALEASAAKDDGSKMGRPCYHAGGPFFTLFYICTINAMLFKRREYGTAAPGSSGF